MKKEKLIEIGLDEAQIEKVLGVINDEMKNFIPKSRFDEVNTEKKNLEVQIKERDEQLKTLKQDTKENEELQNKIKQLETNNKEIAEKHKEEIARLKLENAIDGALLSAKSRNNTAVKSLLDMSKIKYVDEKLIGLDEQLEVLKREENSSFLFNTEEKKEETAKFVGVTPAIGNTQNAGKEEPTIFSALQNLYQK